MDSVDGTTHYLQSTSSEDTPSHLALILDTNPYAWALLAQKSLPLSTALSHLLLFLNTHLSFSHSARTAVFASHSNRASFLYPSPHPTTSEVEAAPNKFRPFRELETTVRSNLTKLLTETSKDDIQGHNETLMAGALSMALSYLSRCGATGGKERLDNMSGQEDKETITARILIISVSGDLSSQYIPVMNAIFAAQKMKVPIDILKLYGDAVFLQQACETTGGVYFSAVQNPQALLQYLMTIFMAPPPTRVHLLPPMSQVDVDFRAACFCHQRVCEIGFVCSVCLSIFCSPPENAICTTCSTKLNLATLKNYGGKPAIALVKKKKAAGTLKKKGAVGTPASGSTPGTPAPPPPP